MAWQNQPSSMSNPWPANAPYPGQPGQQFPGQPAAPVPWQPGPQFPSRPDVSPGGYPGQPISGQAAPIPPEVSQAAERAGLGAPTREYNRGAGNSSVTNVFGGMGGLIGIIGGGVGVLVGVLVPLMVVQFPLNLIFAGVALVCILPFVFIFRWLFRNSGLGSSALRVWGCPDGLVYMQGRQVSAIRWEQLGLVFRKTALVNGAQAIIGYAVQPIEAPPFEFIILGGAFGSLASAGAGRPGMSIETGAGRVTNYGGIVQIEGLVDASAYVGLGELIEEHLVAYQLPLVRELYQHGQTVAFGKFLLHQRGVSDGVNVVTWEEYDYAGLYDTGDIQVYKKPARTLALQVTGLPNVAVLKRFLQEIRENQRQQALHQ